MHSAIVGETLTPAENVLVGLTLEQQRIRSKKSVSTELIVTLKKRLVCVRTLQKGWVCVTTLQKGMGLCSKLTTLQNGWVCVRTLQKGWGCGTTLQKGWVCVAN